MSTTTDKLLTAVQLHTESSIVTTANSSQNPILYSTKIMKAAGIVANKVEMDNIKTKPKVEPTAAQKAEEERKAAEARKAAAAQKKSRETEYSSTLLTNKKLPSFEEGQPFSDKDDLYRYMIQNTPANVTEDVAELFGKTSALVNAEIDVEKARVALLKTKTSKHNSLYGENYIKEDLGTLRTALQAVEKTLQDKTTLDINTKFNEKLISVGGESDADPDDVENSVSKYIYHSRINQARKNKAGFKEITRTKFDAVNPEEALKIEFEKLLGISDQTVNSELLSIYVDELERLLIEGANNKTDLTVSKIITGETLYNFKNPTGGTTPSDNSIAQSALAKDISKEYTENVGEEEFKISIPTDFNDLFDNLEGEGEGKAEERRIARRMLNKVRQEYKTKLREIQRINSNLKVSIPKSITDKGLIESGVSRDFLYNIARMTDKVVTVSGTDNAIIVKVTEMGSLDSLFSDLINANKVLETLDKTKTTTDEQRHAAQEAKNKAQEDIFAEIDLVSKEAAIEEFKANLTSVQREDLNTAKETLLPEDQRKFEATVFTLHLEDKTNTFIGNLARNELISLATSISSAASETCDALVGSLKKKLIGRFANAVGSLRYLQQSCLSKVLSIPYKGGSRKRDKFTKNKKGGKKKRTLKRSNKKSLKRNKQTGGSDFTTTSTKIIGAIKIAEAKRKAEFESKERTRKAEESNKFYTVPGSECKEGKGNNGSGSSGYIVGSAHCSTSYHCKKFVNVKINGKGHTVFNGLPRFKYTDKEGNTRYDPEYCAPVAYIEYHSYAAGTETTNEYGDQLLEAINKLGAKTILDKFITADQEYQDKSLLIIDNEFCAVDNEGNIKKINEGGVLGEEVILTQVSYGNGQEQVEGEPFKKVKITELKSNNDGYVTVTTPIGTEEKNVTPILV